MGLGDMIGGAKAKLQAAAAKKMLQSQLKKLPPEQREIVMQVLQDNPEFFENIGKEIEAEMKNGKSQMVASMSVMKKYQGKMQDLMQKAALNINSKSKDRNLR